MNHPKSISIRWSLLVLVITTSAFAGRPQEVKDLPPVECDGYVWSGRDCVKACEDGFHWNGRECIAECPDGIALSGDKFCIPACEVHQIWSGNECVDRCEEGLIWNGRECVKPSCEDGYFWNGKYCQENEPTPTPMPTATPTPAAPCVYRNPSVIILPAYQTARPGVQLTYQLGIMNNDSPSCYHMGMHGISVLPQQVPNALNVSVASSVAIAPGFSATVPVYVTSQSSLPWGAYPFTIRVSTPHGAGSAVGTYNVSDIVWGR